MFFDRYEIHIQAFANVFRGKYHSQSSSPQKYSKKYVLNILFETYFQTIQKMFQTHGGYTFQKKRAFSNVQILQYENKIF